MTHSSSRQEGLGIRLQWIGERTKSKRWRVTPNLGTQTPVFGAWDCAYEGKSVVRTPPAHVASGQRPLLPETIAANNGIRIKTSTTCAKDITTRSLAGSWGRDPEDGVPSDPLRRLSQERHLPQDGVILEVSLFSTKIVLPENPETLPICGGSCRPIGTLYIDLDVPQICERSASRSNQ